jgi:polyisoprenoid-binding protein YceI
MYIAAVGPPEAEHMYESTKGRLTRRSALMLPLAVLATVPFAQAAPVAQAARRYAIDKRYGSIEFSVTHLGLFSSHGRFRSFGADLSIDRAHPESTRVEVSIDAGSVEMPWEEGAAMLRSADFFDVTNHPAVHFNSTAITVLAPDHYRVSGLLEIRGVTRPIELDARLTRHQDDAAGEPVSADFVVSGTLSRAAFGMVSQRTFISDTVRLSINARIALADAG